MLYKVTVMAHTSGSVTHSKKPDFTVTHSYEGQLWSLWTEWKNHCNQKHIVKCKTWSCMWLPKVSKVNHWYYAKPTNYTSIPYPYQCYVKWPCMALEHCYLCSDLQLPSNGRLIATTSISAIVFTQREAFSIDDGTESCDPSAIWLAFSTLEKQRHCTRNVGSVCQTTFCAFVKMANGRGLGMRLACLLCHKLIPKLQSPLYSRFHITALFSNLTELCTCLISTPQLWRPHCCSIPTCLMSRITQCASSAISILMHSSVVLKAPHCWGCGT